MNSYDKRAGVIRNILKKVAGKKPAAAVKLPDKIYNRWLADANPETVKTLGSSTAGLIGAGAAVPLAGYGMYKGVDAYQTNERKNDLMSKMPALMGAAGIGLLAGAGAEYGLSKVRDSRAAKEAAVRYLAVLDKLGMSPLMKLGIGAAAGGAGIYGINQLEPVKKFNKKISTGKKIFDITDKVMPYAPLAAGIIGAGLGATGSYYARKRFSRQQPEPVFYGQGYGG